MKLRNLAVPAALPLAAALLHAQAPPPSGAGRFRAYLRDTYGPTAHIGSVAGAAWDQAIDSPWEWQQGSAGFGKRLASRAGRYTIRGTLRFALDEAMDLDSSYQRSKDERFWPRLKHAVGSTYCGRTLDGRTAFGVPRVVAAYTTAAISNVWYPQRLQTVGDTLLRGTRVLAWDAARSVLKEFWPEIRRTVRRR